MSRASLNRKFDRIRALEEAGKLITKIEDAKTEKLLMDINRPEGEFT